MLNTQDISAAKQALRHRLTDALHEHDDCICIAYEWLDAQKRIKAPRKIGGRPLKHIIENWAGRYVSQADVEIAAYLHPDIVGTYPYFNISARLVEPSRSRLTGLTQAGTQENYLERFDSRTYSSKEA